jgi:hypothetical protein
MSVWPVGLTRSAKASDLKEILMKKWMTSVLRVAPLLMGSLGLFSGCEPQGPAERAGENIDRAVNNAKDRVSPSGPMEKAGENLDKAVGK